MKVVKIIVATLILMCVSTHGYASKSVSYDGYFVDHLINNTIELFEERNILSFGSTTAKQWYRDFHEAQDQQESGMLPTFPFINFQQSLLNYCMEKNLITRAQALIALDKCKHCGGTTINGYNLLVLHVYILSDLVENKRITQKEAQNLLDSSKKED